MFVVRDVNKSDLEDLYSLSKQALLLNLPSNKNIIEELISKSIKSFHDPDTNDLSKNYYLFGLEDTTQNKVVGISMIHGKHGTPESPHFFLKVGKEVKTSKTLEKNFIHQTLKFGFETDGHTEIGGLVLDEKYRGHKLKLGKLLSLSRFMYIAMNVNNFTKTIHSELMPPLTKDGSSLLWEAVGRKFFDMEYWEADKLSQTNKEFLLSLFPKGTIYTKLLPNEVVNVIGEVGIATRPVRKMLKSIGFEYTEEVDPFDGGPHYRCNKKEIKVIKNSNVKKIHGFSPITDPNLIAATKPAGGKFICTYGQLTSNEILLPHELKTKISTDKKILAYDL